MTRAGFVTVIGYRYDYLSHFHYLSVYRTVGPLL